MGGNDRPQLLVTGRGGVESLHDRARIEKPRGIQIETRRMATDAIEPRHPLSQGERRRPTRRLVSARHRRGRLGDRPLAGRGETPALERPRHPKSTLARSRRRHWCTSGSTSRIHRWRSGVLERSNFLRDGQTSALVDPYVMGTFGAGILDGYRLILDYGNRRIALEK